MGTLRIIIAFSCLLLLSHQPVKSPAGRIPGYDLSRPDKRQVLPETLHEISGITHVKDDLLACVQDENGVLFMYDLSSNSIQKEIFFGYNGDYEGLARVHKDIYVLRSDGVIYEVPDFASGSKTTIYHESGIPAQNNEGLCYDAAKHRLLVGCKGKTAKGPAFKDRREIYAFNLKEKKLDPKPVITLDVNAVSDFAIRNKIIPAFRENKKGRSMPNSIRLSTSEIALHPVTGQLFLLSAADHMLLVFDMQGKIQHIHALDPAVFNKPEGITFFSDGDMLITNEGEAAHPTLLRFNYRRQG